MAHELGDSIYHYDRVIHLPKNIEMIDWTYIYIYHLIVVSCIYGNHRVIHFPIHTELIQRTCHLMVVDRIYHYAGVIPLSNPIAFICSISIKAIQ